MIYSETHLCKVPSGLKMFFLESALRWNCEYPSHNEFPGLRFKPNWSDTSLGLALTKGAKNIAAMLARKVDRFINEYRYFNFNLCAEY